MDPLATKYPSWSPYNYVLGNPIKFIDPDGRSVEGDFVNSKGKLIGNDGKDDGKVHVIKTTETSFESGLPSAGISRKEARSTKKFIKKNSGNTNAFQNNSIAYDNSVEIVGSSQTRQTMVDIVNQDNGRGGTLDANNREFGGSINIDGTVTQAPAGAIGNPAENKNISVTLTTSFPDQSTFHSHPSGTRTDGNSTSYWVQPPSIGDMNNSGSTVNYVFGRGDKTVYIYNNQGVIATLPQKNFANPKK